MTRRKPLPLNSIRAFEAAARLGRLKAAADELSVTHGAVSRQVRHLEEFLGVALFEGPTSRHVLTSAGARLVAALTPALDQIDAAVRAVGDTKTGTLDVACFSTLAIRWLIPRLHRFQSVHPAIEVRLSTDENRIDATRGAYDVMITVLDSETRPMAADVVLFAEHLGLVLAPSLMKPTGARTLADLPVLADLADLPRLVTRTRLNAWAQWTAISGIDDISTRRKPTAEFEHYSLTIEAAANGLGVCVVPFHLVADAIQNRRLVAPWGFVSSGYRYIARRGDPKSHKCAQFVAWLKQEAATLDTAVSTAIQPRKRRRPSPR